MSEPAFVAERLASFELKVETGLVGTGVVGTLVHEQRLVVLVARQEKDDTGSEICVETYHGGADTGHHGPIPERLR